MRRIVILFLIVLAIGSACWFFMRNGVSKVESVVIAQKNNQNLSKLKIGMTKKDVLALMGKPQKIEVYSLGGRIFEFLVYRTQGFKLYLNDPENNFTPVAIDTNSATVLSWDKKFYDQVIEQSRTIK